MDVYGNLDKLKKITERVSTKGELLERTLRTNEWNCITWMHMNKGISIYKGGFGFGFGFGCGCG